MFEVGIIIGQRFGRLTTTGEVEKRNGRTYQRCVCDCGNTVSVRQDALTSGRTESCGCLHKEKVSTPIVDGRKKCSICGEWKSIDNFHEDHSMKSGLKSSCKDCIRKTYTLHRDKRIETAKRWKSENHEKCMEYSRKSKATTLDFIESLKTTCQKCGESRLYVIEFHHIDPSTKLFSIGGSSHSKDHILKEREKCVCLCANCHREFHHLYGHTQSSPQKSLTEYLQGEKLNV